MVVAGRVTETGDVAIMMVEAEATEHDLEPRRRPAPRRRPRRSSPSGLDAAKPFIKQLCEAQAELAKQAAKPVQEFPVFLDYEDDVVRRRRGRRQGRRPPPALTIAGKQEREDRARRASRPSLLEKLGRRVRGSREGDRRGVPLAQQVAGPRARAARQGPHRRPRPGRHPAAARRGRRDPAGARLGAVRARRDPDPGRHHAEHADAWSRSSTRSPRRSTRRYMHKYVFPPFSTGETGRVGSPKRREVGHGALAAPGAAAGAADARGVPLRDPPALRGDGLQRLHLDGLGLRLDAVAAAGRRAAARRRSPASRWA